MKTGIITICVALAASLATTTKAQTGTPMRVFGNGDLPAITGAYDLNGDGVLSQEERDAMRADRRDRHEDWMREWDTNADGAISTEECDAARTNLQQRVETTRQDRFDEADTNSDGYLSLDEFSVIPPMVRLTEEHPGAPRAIFEGLDTNHDGQVDAEEFMQQLRQHDRMPLNQAFRVADTNADRTLSTAEFCAIPSMVELARSNPNGPQNAFANLDTNTNGQLSLEEFLAQPPCPEEQPRQDPFAIADTNSDGFLSLAEFSAMPAMVHLATMNPNGPQQVFNRLDANDDQQIGPVEFLLMPPPTEPEPGPGLPQ
jgi:Ca2+-binding EF-hand superfamily protein